jgi:hypothetical protein
MSISRWRPALTFLALLAPAASCWAQALDHRLIGAWTPSAADCAKVFEKRGGQLRFRAPVDQFSSAFIIGPRKIIAAGGECNIGKTSQKADAVTLHLECNNSIGYAPQTSMIIIKSDVEINYDATGNDPMMTVSYQKCPL